MVIHHSQDILLKVIMDLAHMAHQEVMVNQDGVHNLQFLKENQQKHQRSQKSQQNYLNQMKLKVQILEIQKK
jgi:hypothetical protein